MNPTDLDNLIQDYLSRLDAALRGLPTSRRQQLLAEITQHLEESRARLPEQSEASIRDLLDRVATCASSLALSRWSSQQRSRYPSL